ncbi:MAG: peptidoglycan DD-metalloendopeptidase family protein [Polyangiaceae bacterium]|nr:peptidoglycan DD-metalloendopeptidase family protein [Polyangiaceae bacterium]
MSSNVLTQIEGSRKRHIAVKVLWPLALISVATVSKADLQADFGSKTDTSESTTAAAQAMDAELARLTEEIRQVDAKLETLGDQQQVVRHRLIARGRAYYRLRHAGLLPLGSGFDSLMDHTSRVERLRRAVEKDAQLASSMEKERLSLIAHKNSLNERKLPLEIQQRTMAEAQVALLESADRKQAYDRAFGPSKGEGGDYTAVYGAPSEGLFGPSRDALRGSLGGFRSLEGRLPFPVVGRTEVRTVRRRGAGGPGLEMGARVGADVLAVFSGRVAFADDYDPFGSVVILDHGDQYFTVSGDLGTIDVRVGEEVGAGSRIGTVGRGKGGGLLYFEIRQGADTLEPGSWFGL